MIVQLAFRTISHNTWVTCYEPTTDEMIDINTPVSDPKHTWTVLDCDGVQIISSGIHFVNRMGYYFTKHPHDFMVDVQDD